MNVFTEKYGEGKELIIMIPGGPGLSYHYLEPLAQDFANQGYTLWVYEPTGYPNNNPEQFLTSVEALAEELERLIKCTGKQPVLYGHSIGGSVVLEFLVKHPDYKGKAILSNTFPSGSILKKAIANRFNSFSEEVKESYRSFKKDQNYEGIGGIVFTEWLPKHMCQTQPMPESLQTSIGLMVSTQIQGHFIGPDLFDIDGVFNEWDVENQLKTVTTSVLCISGKWDYLMEEMNKEWMTKLTHSEIWISDEASHTPFMEDEDKHRDTIIKFLKHGE